MADTSYTTRELLGVQRSLKRVNPFLVGRYFKNYVVSDKEEVSYDIELHDEALAPFVAPVVAGEIMEEQGFETTTIKPAYIKIKTPFTPMKSIKRQIGEAFGSGTMTREQRQQLRVAMTIVRHQDRISRRLEWMAAQILVTGGLIIEGPRYPKKAINYGRAAALGITLVGADRWSDAASNPVRDIENFAAAAFNESGAVITEIVMDKDAWAAFRENERVLKLLDIRRAEGAGPLNLGPQAPVAEGAVHVGSLNSFQLFVYNNTYKDSAGTRQPYLPSGTVLGVSAQFDGVRYFGAIEDEEAGIQPMETFMKSWLEKDPSARILLSQTAPILAPGRKDAAFAAKVL